MKLTKKNLIWALCRLMEGVKEHEVYGMTGLAPYDCSILWQIYTQARKEPFSHPSYND
jgi:hypothetical protein